MKSQIKLLYTLMLATPFLFSCASGEDGYSESSVNSASGIADQDSFSLSLSNLSPEGGNVDGTEVDVTVRAADRNNFPIPAGNVIHFKTSGGSIVSKCTVEENEDGVSGCTVKWTSQDPRPADGRVQILAYTLGEESYIDANGNDQFDGGDTPANDLDEAFLDNDLDGSFDPAADELVDLNGDGVYNGPNGIYNGQSCTDGAACDNTLVHVRDTGTLIMANSHFDEAALLASLVVNPAPASDAASTISFTLAGFNGQVLPSGTTLSVEGNNVTIEVEPLFNELGTSYSVPVTWDTGPIAAQITIETTTPGGRSTQLTLPFSVP